MLRHQNREISQQREKANKERKWRKLRLCLVPNFLYKMNMIAFLFVFDKYCIIMD